MDSVVHFEMPAEDKNRVKQFYETAFNWSMQQLGPEMGDYLLANTTETDNNGMIKKPGAINGGFYQKGEYGTMPHVVIGVENLENSMKLVKDNGGKIEGEIQEISGIGKFVMFRDTEGNRVGMLEPLEMKK